ncbi:MAG: hypothetical protein ACE5SW_09780 [Nitrososphaeraceae archaeon]
MLCTRDGYESCSLATHHENHIDSIKYINETDLYPFAEINFRSQVKSLGTGDIQTSYYVDSILFYKDGLGYALEYRSNPDERDKYMTDFYDFATQILRNINN